MIDIFWEMNDIRREMIDKIKKAPLISSYTAFPATETSLRGRTD